MSDNGPFIENKQHITGCYYALKNAEHFAKTAESLYSEKNYQASIPLATVSIEESLKGYELIRRFSQGNDIAKKDWEDIKNHKFKLTHSFADLISGLRGIDDSRLEDVRRDMEKIGLPFQLDKDKTIKGLEEKSLVYSHFKGLRESCLYVDWNSTSRTWTGFNSDDTIDSLSFFVLKEAQLMIIHLKSRIERVINELREKGGLLIELPFPSYKEHRDIENHESTQMTRELASKLDETKMKQGLNALKKFVSTKNLDSVSPSMLQERILEYVKQLMKQDEPCAHPLFKALMIALSKSEDQVGNVMAYSDDSDCTLDKEPYMCFAVVIGRENDKRQIREIKDLQNYDYKFDNAVLERILRTEVVLERVKGKDVPISKFVEALSKIGVKAKVLKLSDIPDAVKYTNELIKDNHIEKNQYFTSDVISEIKSLIDSKQWDNISSISRTTISIVYGRVKYPGYNMYIVPSERIEKFKCRKLILESIEKNHIPTI